MKKSEYRYRFNKNGVNFELEIVKGGFCYLAEVPKNGIVELPLPSIRFKAKDWDSVAETVTSAIADWRKQR